MSASSVDAKQIRLEDLLDAVEDGTAALPEFQRDFDWSNADVVSLLATLLSDWPAGSLLLMSGRPAFFEIRNFEDGPDPEGDIDYVVLDGQQRLTALFHALRGYGPLAFVLKAEAFDKSDGTAEAIEELVMLVPHAEWRRDYPLARQSHERLVPMHELRTASDFFAWRDKLLDATPEKERGAVGQLMARIYRSHLGRLNTYAFPAVILDNALPPAAVARIFERINLTGLRLNTFDLLVARVYEIDWNLRERWETARREIEPVAHWLGDDGLPVLQLISLHVDGDVRQPALLSLRARDIKSHWDPAISAMAEGVRELRTWGIPLQAWMPYKGLLLPLAERVLALGSGALEDHGQLTTWFWARSFGMDYSVGSSTRIALDARLLGEKDPDWTSANFAIDRRLLQKATRRQQSALYSAFISQLSSNEACDLLTGEKIEDPASDGVVVSLFAKGDAGHHLRVFGMVLLTRASASKLRKDRDTFLAEIREDVSSSQLLPQGGITQLLTDPEKFFEVRVALLEERLNGLSMVEIRWFDGRDS